MSDIIIAVENLSKRYLVGTSLHSAKVTRRCGT